MARLKIRKQIWDQFHLAMDKCELDEFSSFFLIDNVFGKLEGKILSSVCFFARLFFYPFCVYKICNHGDIFAET